MGNSPCKVKHGEGVRQWPWTECEVVFCNDGYEEDDGDCIVLSGSCTLRPGVTGAKSYVYDSTGNCVVETCDSEYILEGGKCVRIGSSGSTTGESTTGESTTGESTTGGSTGSTTGGGSSGSTTGGTVQTDVSGWSELSSSLGTHPTYNITENGPWLNSSSECAKKAATFPSAVAWTWRSANNTFDKLSCYAFAYSANPTGIDAFVKDAYPATSSTISGCINKFKKYPYCV